MGLMSWVLGGGAKQAAAAVGQVAGVFKPNAGASETRGHAYDRAALAQYTAEFAHPRRGWFDGLGGRAEPPGAPGDHLSGFWGSCPRWSFGRRELPSPLPPSRFCRRAIGRWSR